MRVLKEENKKMQKVAVGVEAEKKRLEAIIYGPKPQSSRRLGQSKLGRSKSPINTLKNSQTVAMFGLTQKVGNKKK